MSDGQSSAFGQLLRSHRVAAGLSQEALAERAGLSTRGISDLERGLRSTPQRQTIRLLADALELSAADRAALEEAVERERGPASVQPRALPAGLTVLPVPSTELIGREAEVADLEALLGDRSVRLVTLLGPGGVGKTHLAQHVAARLQTRFAGGACFVDLAPVADPVLVAPTLARALGLGDPGGQPVQERLAAELRNRELLLVLDNFEQVVAAASTVGELLAAAPGLKALVTSRAVLGLRAEHEFVVPSLALPDLRELPPLEALALVPAVRLLVERTRAVNGDFALTAATAPAVAEICTRLDGLPLAVELAAAQADVYGPQEIAAGLRKWGLGVLADGQLDRPARQRTMRSAIAWSDALLAPDEQRLFSRLAVFAGGFALESVSAVCLGAASLERATWEGVAALARKSLVRRLESNGETRFSLLETIREYALERLDAAGEADAVRERHAAHYAALAEAAARAPSGAEQEAWFARLEREHANLRAALRWLGSHGDDAGALRLAAALWRFWLAHGHRVEGRQWLGEVLALPGAQAPSSPRAESLLGLATLGAPTYGRPVLPQEWARARPLAEESLALFRRLGDRAGTARALQLVGRMTLDAGDSAAARAAFEESLATARELGKPEIATEAVLGLALVARQSGDFATARALLTEGLPAWRGRGDRASVAHALRHLAWMLSLERDFATTRALLEECLALHEEVGDRWMVGTAYGDLAEVMTAQGDFGAARRVYEAGLSHWRELGDRQWVANMQNGLSYILAEDGEYERARVLLREALLVRLETGSPIRVGNSVAGFAYLAAAQGRNLRAMRLAGAAAALRQVPGRLLGSTVVRLERKLGPVRQVLGEAIAAAAWAEGETMTQEEAVAAALDDTE